MPLFCFSASNEELFEQANALYRDGDFDRAVQLYEEILESGYESAELYYNLGNAYFKREALGKSILYYERARKLDPHDEDSAYNISVVQLYAKDRLVVPPQLFVTRIWQKLTGAFSTDQLAVWTLVFYSIVMLLLILRKLILKPGLQKTVKAVMIPVVVLFSLAVFLFFFRARVIDKRQQAIVMVEMIDVTSSPSSDSTPVFTLHEGAKVNLQERSGSYLKISLPDGNVGWVPDSSLEII